MTGIVGVQIQRRVIREHESRGTGLKPLNYVSSKRGRRTSASSPARRKVPPDFAKILSEIGATDFDRTWNFFAG